MVQNPEKIAYSYGECTIAGKDNEGKVNEDSVSSFIPPSLRSSESPIKGLFCVADGFGGPGSGDAASRETVNLVKEVFTSGEYVNWAKTRGIDPGDVSKVLHAAVCQISLVINSYAEKHNQKMGTTLEALVFTGNRFHIAHAGNSRIYLMRKGIVYRLTQDHEVPETPEDLDSPVNMLGLGKEVTVDVFSDQVQPGDTFILCTDGITKSVTEDEIKFALANTDTPQEACEKLARLADRRGGSDNISITIVSTARPGMETRPPIRMEEILPKPVELEAPSRTWRMAFIGAMALVVVALSVVAYLVFFRTQPKPGFIASWDPERGGVVIALSNIPKDTRYIVYRGEGEAFEAASKEPPTNAEWSTQSSLTQESPETLDQTVEEGKVYYYTAYRQVTGWNTELDLDSMIVSEPVKITISGTGSAVDTGTQTPTYKETLEKFRNAYDSFRRLEQKYAAGYSGGSEGILDALRDYKDEAFVEIDGLIELLKPYDHRSDLVWNDKTPATLIKDLNLLKQTMVKSMEDDGLRPYLAGLREMAIKTNFTEASLDQMPSIKDEIDGSEWEVHKNELNVLIKLYNMNSDVENYLVRFDTPGFVEHKAGWNTRELKDIFRIYYSKEKASNPETLEAFYSSNPDARGKTRLDDGVVVKIPDPEFHRGGDKLEDVRTRLEEYPESALLFAKKVEDLDMSSEYAKIVALYEIKAEYWLLVADNPKSLKEDLENLDSVRATGVPFYSDSQVRSLIRKNLALLGDKEPADDEKLKALTEERKRLGLIFETIDPEEKPEEFAAALKDFEKLKEEVNAESEPRYDALKETVASLQETVDFIRKEVSGEHVVQLAQADKLVDEVGDISAVKSGYEEAIGKLEEAIDLYEKALESIASAEDRRSVSAKVAKIKSNITLLKSRAEGGFKPVRWGKEIDELSLAELLVYLRKLTSATDELAESLKDEQPEVYTQEIESATERAKELQDLASKRIVRRFEPGGPEFDSRNFEKGIAEFKYLTFVMTSIVEDATVAAELKVGLEELSENVEDGILINHLRYEGAYKEFATSIHNAVASAIRDISDGFVDALGLTEVKAKIVNNEGEEYFEPIREFVDSISEAAAGAERGRSKYFVEVLVPPKEDDALALARVLAKEKYPLAGMKLMTGESYMNGRSYRVAAGWYKDKKDAETAAKEISRIPEAFKFISSVAVRKQSEY